MKIELGDEVKCKITGFKGTAISKQEHINGCSHYQIQPKIKKDGTLPDAEWVDELQLEVTKKKKISRKTDTGGPQLTKPMPRIKSALRI